MMELGMPRYMWEARGDIPYPAWNSCCTVQEKVMLKEIEVN